MENQTQVNPPHPRRPRNGVRGWSTGSKLTALVVGLVAIAAGVVGLGLATLWAVNPMADEWVCGAGEAPVVPLSEDPTMTGCRPIDAKLPDGLRWDPLGHRPMSYNCDQDGWRLIERDTRKGHVAQECLNEHLGLPKGWRVAEDG